jgi:hypothetical protein
MPLKTTAVALAGAIAVLTGCGAAAPQASTTGSTTRSSVPEGPVTGLNGEVISQAEIQREARKTEAEVRRNEAKQAREFKAQQARERRTEEEGPAIEQEERKAKQEREADGVAGGG